MLTLAPGLGLWDVAQHVSWLASVLIVVTKGCAVLIPVTLVIAWFWPEGLRGVLAALLALFLVIVIREAIAGALYVPRPFVAYHFTPLYPHSADSAFPSLTTSYFTAAGWPLWRTVVIRAGERTWRPLGWLYAAMTIEVGFGCVYVGVHYTTDVLAGAAIGAICGLAAWLLFGYGPAGWLVRLASRGLAWVRLRPGRTAPAQVPATGPSLVSGR